MLKQLQDKIRDAHQRLALRKTIKDVAQIGAWLIEAKAQLEHGQFLLWLAAIPIDDRNAQIYMAASRAFHEKPDADETMTLNQFNGWLKNVRNDPRPADGKEERAEAHSKVDAGEYKVHHADCRKFEFPAFDHIVTDPPWMEIECYQWLAEFAFKNLKDGGLLLTLCGNTTLRKVMTTFQEFDFYHHCVIVYNCNALRRTGPFVTAHVSALLLGINWQNKQKEIVTDTVSINDAKNKRLHPWQQPLKPFVKWIETLTEPGSKICDPFSGSGTTASPARRQDGDLWERRLTQSIARSPMTGSLIIAQRALSRKAHNSAHFMT